MLSALTIMEDPLKPKPVPLAAETVLWFEFLLDPNKITQHLQQTNPEPSAVELIMQFISMTPEVTFPAEVVTPGSDIQTSLSASAALTIPTIQRNIDCCMQLTRKQLALKILELKVATWLKWDLDLLEKNLPVAMQLGLLRDLCTVSYGRGLPIPLPNDFDMKISPTGNEHAARFALTMYHRMVLRIQLLKETALGVSRQPTNNGYHTVDIMLQFLDIPTQPSIEYLQQLCISNKPFYVFHYDSFITLQCDNLSTVQNYEIMHLISPEELRGQIQYELAHYYLFTKQYVLAREAASACNINLQSVRSQTFQFCHIQSNELEGLLQACGYGSHCNSLLQRFHMSVLSEYTDIVPILKLDNRAREIPLVNRRILELEIESAISAGLLKQSRHLEVQVATLNVVRNIFESGNIFSCVEFFSKYREKDYTAAIVEAIEDVLPHCTHDDKVALKQFVIDCVLHNVDGNQFLQATRSFGIFTDVDLKNLDLLLSIPTLPNSKLATLSDWICHSKMARIDIGVLERQLINCTNANTVRILLVKLCARAPGKPVWAINPNWDVPQPLKTLIMAMPVSFLQDFSYVLLGKARELAAHGDYCESVSMLSVLKSETQRQELGNAQLISKLITWEILHTQIAQCLEEWHQKTLDQQSLASRCKQCLGALSDTVPPRIEIVNNCAVMLLNLSEFQPLMFLDKRLPQLELTQAFASTFMEMEKMKGPKKVCRDAWELMLSMFLSVPKRVGPNIPACGTSLQQFLQRVRHQSVFGLAISMLGKIHNILKDDANHDLNLPLATACVAYARRCSGYSRKPCSFTRKPSLG
ncbi:integrator complex subunit 8 isoform X2 [Scaptodrosophila lebanonensis]|uniref:Integrator complex subunit 8 isoform X2 n=1 Tax=Drosophila lebanonensis TaxID=7225 RepID=A0A6J2T3V1_DROLE|nr:integrator complex subunit 8 isoform X2 [Scaptodrosophila lebanonensis]